MLEGMEMSAGEEHRPPAGETELKLVDIWAEVLKTDKKNISITANFFESGGNSISIIKLNKMINEAFPCNIPVVDMFRFPSLLKMKELIEHRDNGNHHTAAMIGDAFEEASHHLRLMEDL
jgi:acyl carrier protein